MENIIIHSDGGSRGNPGPAGVGVVIEHSNGKEELSEFIGEATNNVAEYTAVIKALEWTKANFQTAQVQCFLDSQLVVEQLNGNYKMKNEGLKPLFWQVRGLIMDLGGKVNFKYIPREQNKEADTLVNRALDEQTNR